MKVKELKEILSTLPDDGEVYAEEKISGGTIDFEILMYVWTYDNDVYFGLR